MTPAARVQAAIEVLDRIGQGAATEQALTAWARGARYAGSKDRAAVRDHVFAAIRCRRSLAALGGGEGGRAIMIGALREAGAPLDDIFSGAPHAPAPLDAAERAAGHPPEGAARVDLPDWLWPMFRASLGDAAEAVALALRERAGVHLRVNVARTDRDGAIAALAADGVAAEPHPAADTALAVTEGARRIRQARAYAEGIVELQDAASQALARELPVAPGAKVLDYCAGGGGKALALAALGAGDGQGLLVAHDADPGRMRDLPERARRAGARIRQATTAELAGLAPFDLVLCDAPCSGSGSWRRAPDGKWALTPDRLEELRRIQSGILDDAAPLVAAGGVLAYATCSVLRSENDDQVADFQRRHPGWTLQKARNWPVSGGNFGTDGFHLSVLTRKT